MRYNSGYNAGNSAGYSSGYSAGVTDVGNNIYSTCVAYGTTPSSNSSGDISTAIGSIATAWYGKGVTDGVGSVDTNAYYNNGYNARRNAEAYEPAFNLILANGWGNGPRATISGAGGTNQYVVIISQGGTVNFTLPKYSGVAQTRRGLYFVNDNGCNTYEANYNGTGYSYHGYVTYISFNNEGIKCSYTAQSPGAEIVSINNGSSVSSTDWTVSRFLIINI